MSFLSLLAIAAALGVVVLAGAALLRLLQQEQYAQTGDLERYGLSWVLGTGYVSLALFLTGFVTRGIPLIATVSGGAAILFAWSRRNPTAPSAPRQPLRNPEWILWGILIAQAGFLLWWTPQLALGWDALAVWEAKARSAVAHGGTLPLHYFNDPPGKWAQPLYPLSWPYTEGWLYLWLGRADQSWVRVLGPITYSAAVAILAGAAQRLGASRLASLASATAFFFVPYCFSGLWNLLTGYADFPLGVVYLAAASRLPGLGRDPSASEVRLFAVLAGGATWVKQEGVFLWLILMGIAGILLLRQRRCRDILVVAVPGAIIAGGFKLFLNLAGAPTDPAYHPPTLENFLNLSERIVPVAMQLGRELLNLESWSLLWIGALLAIVVILGRRQLTLAFIFSTAIGLPLFFFLWPFVLSALDDYDLHIQLALPRLLLQIAPIAMLAIAVAGPRKEP